MTADLKKATGATSSAPAKLNRNDEPWFWALQVPGEAVWAFDRGGTSEVLGLSELNNARIDAGMPSLIASGTSDQGPLLDSPEAFIEDCGLQEEIELVQEQAAALFGDAFRGVSFRVKDDTDLGGPQLVIEVTVGEMDDADFLARQRLFLDAFYDNADPDHLEHLIVKLRPDG